MKDLKNTGRKSQIAAFTIFVASVIFIGGTSPAATLSNPTRTANQFQLTVTGETNAMYIVEASTNLQQWLSVLTNSEPGIVRTITLNASGPQNYYRIRNGLFAVALAAKRYIELNGYNLTTDSFDSTDPERSTNGQYDPAKAGDHGDVATYCGLTNSQSVGNASIKGVLWTGPGGTMAIGPNGRVGSIAWHANPSTAGMIEPGWARDDANLAFADVTLPPGFVWTPGAGSISGTNYTYVLGDANYRLIQLSMSGNQTLVVTGRVSLYVSGSVSMSGNSSILITPGASLTLYVGGPNASIGGYGIINQNANPLTFSYCGLPTNTSVDFGGNGTFIGTIYAPNAWVALHGVGDQHFIGAVVAKTITMSGHFNFHYDENLKHVAPAY
jgi:hypothetical protein